MSISLLIGIFLGTLFVLLLRERQKNLREVEPENWKNNTGKQPALFNVDVIYKNGKRKDYEPAKKLDWSLEVENPIIGYRKYEMQQN